MPINMETKTKNQVTVFLLVLLAFGIYLYALPAEVFEAIGKMLKHIVNGG